MSSNPKIAKLKISFYISVFLNVFPIFGAFFYNWNIQDILFIYLFENITIFLVNQLKIQKIKNSTKAKNILKKVKDTRFFFTFHYGGFTFMNILYIFLFFGGASQYTLPLFLTIISIIANQLISYLKYFVIKGQNKIMILNELITASYRRMIPFFISLILGSCFMLGTDTKNWYIPLFSLVIMKTLIDLLLYKIEYNWEKNN